MYLTLNNPTKITRSLQGQISGSFLHIMLDHITESRIFFNLRTQNSMLDAKRWSTSTIFRKFLSRLCDISDYSTSGWENNSIKYFRLLFTSIAITQLAHHIHIYTLPTCIPVIIYILLTDQHQQTKERVVSIIHKQLANISMIKSQSSNLRQF